MRTLKEGQRVRHNYKDGHGLGTIDFVRHGGEARLSYGVTWDNGVKFPYTYNDDTQEIVPVDEDKFANDKPFEHRSHNGTVFTGNACDFRLGVKAVKPAWIGTAKFAADCIEFAAWHRSAIWGQLNGFSGYDTLRLEIVTEPVDR